MVKLLILMFISGYAHASTLVSITNSEGQSMSQEFNTEAEADTYILNTKHRWGKSTGWRRDNCIGQTATRIDAYGTVEYNCPDEFTVTKTDTTAAVAAKNALKDLQEDISFGINLYSQVILMISTKPGMTRIQRRAIRATFADIRLDLYAGQLCDARDDIISNVSPTATITQANIDSVVNLINAYKVCI